MEDTLQVGSHDVVIVSYIQGIQGVRTAFFGVWLPNQTQQHNERFLLHQLHHDHGDRMGQGGDTVIPMSCEVEQVPFSDQDELERKPDALRSDEVRMTPVLGMWVPM